MQQPPHLHVSKFVSTRPEGSNVDMNVVESVVLRQFIWSFSLRRVAGKCTKPLKLFLFVESAVGSVDSRTS